MASLIKSSTNAEFVLFCDNLEGQIADDFRETVRALNGIPWYGVKNDTDIWQPVDGGYAATLKALVKQEFFKWLDDVENCEKWYGVDSKITATEKRILISHWCGNAYRKLTSSKYDDFRRRLFTKTGCLITADGSEDYLISPEGLPDYTVPPVLLEPSISAPQLQPIPSEDAERNAFDVFDDFEGADESDDFEILEEFDLDGNIFDVLDG